MLIDASEGKICSLFISNLEKITYLPGFKLIFNEQSYLYWLNTPFTN